MLMRISEVMKESDLVPNVHCHIDKGLMEMTSAFYTCDRIFTTPIPLMYTRHTARFLLIWLLTVPMALYHEFRKSQTLCVPFIIPLISFFNAIFLFGIEELGVQIEEPFSILPLANICNDIQYAGEDLLLERGISWFESIEKPIEKSSARFEAEKEKLKTPAPLSIETFPYSKKATDILIIADPARKTAGGVQSAAAPIEVPSESDVELSIARKDLEDAVSRNISISSVSKKDLTITFGKPTPSALSTEEVLSSPPPPPRDPLAVTVPSLDPLAVL
jgi:Bestrophin, RFP-TM, chloride channel